MFFLKNLFASLMIAVALFAFAQIVAGQKSGDSLADRRVRINPDPLSISSALKEIAADYDIPIGFQQTSARKGSEEPDIRLASEEMPLSDVLNQIVSEDPAYSWDIRDGVINVHPRVRESSILDVQVGRFQYSTSSPLSLTSALFNIEAVKTKLGTLKLKPLVATFGSVGGGWETPVILEVRNVTLLDLLNKIAKQSESHYWVVGTWNDNQQIGL